MLNVFGFPAQRVEERPPRDVMYASQQALSLQPKVEANLSVVSPRAKKVSGLKSSLSSMFFTAVLG